MMNMLARPTLSALWDSECGDDLGFIVRSRHAALDKDVGK
jgi:hypothetical protein